MITKEDIEGLKVPVTMACTGMVLLSFYFALPAGKNLHYAGISQLCSNILLENDQLFPDNVRAEGQKYLVDNGIPHEIQVFPGVPHGQYPACPC